VTKSFTHRVILPLGMVLLVALVYVTSLDIPRQPDDGAALRKNLFEAPSPAALKLWTQPYYDGLGNDPNLYRPVTTFTYWLGDRTISSGLIQLRVVNLLLLALLGWAIACWFGRYVHPFAAWLAAGLFVAHPSNASNIHHIVGRADLLAMLGAVGFLLAQRAAFTAGRWRLPHIAMAVIFAAVAFGSKETGLLLVPVAFVQGWRLRTPDDEQGTQGRTTLRAWGVLWMALPLVLYVVGRVYAIGWWQPYAPGPDDITGNPLRGVDFFERLPAALATAWFYFRRTFLPVPGYSYETMAIGQWSHLSTWLGIGVLALSTALFVRAFRRRKWAIVGIIFAFGQYALVSNIITPGGVYVSPDLTLPFVFAATATIAWVVASKTVGSPRRRAVAVLLFLALGSGMIAMVQWKAIHSQDSTLALQVRAEQDESDVVAQYLLARHDMARAMQMTDIDMRRNRLLEAAKKLEKALVYAPESIQLRKALVEAYDQAERPLYAQDNARLCLAKLDAFLTEHPGNRPAFEIYQDLKQHLPPDEVPDDRFLSPYDAPPRP
jgi:hypothetical protein